MFKDNLVEKAQPRFSEESSTNLPNSTIHNSQINIVDYKEDYKDLALQTKDIILEDIEDAPLGTSQLEINNTKEYWKKQINHAVTNYKKPSGSSIEDSVWAPNKNDCKKPGLYKAKIAAVSLPKTQKKNILDL